MTIGHSSQALPAREKRAAQFRRVCLAGTVALAVSVSLSSCSERLDAQVPPGAPANPVAAPAPVPVPAPIAPAVAPRVARFADFGAEMAQADARHVADWVADSQNNAGMEFIIVDKQNARVYVFDATAHLRATSAVLLGSAKGDESVPGIGTRPLAQVKPSERTTPAGRFLAERGHNTSGEDVIWVDYNAAVSMHRVRASNPRENRLQRLATPTADDNRISFGCINVPAVFYNAYVSPIFAKRRAVVYVLPDVKSVQAVFGSYDVAAAHGLAAR
jgi:hypothetical protein